MKKGIIYNPGRLLLIISFLSMGCLLSSFIQPGPWAKLGTQSVSFKTDYDEIYVTGRRGTFSHLRLAVDKANIHLSKVVVIYRHGSPETVLVRKNIPAGSATRSLNLKGGNRIIHKVVFYYKTHAYEGKRAKVTLWGMH